MINFATHERCTRHCIQSRFGPMLMEFCSKMTLEESAENNRLCAAKVKQNRAQGRRGHWTENPPNRAYGLLLRLAQWRGP